MGLKRDRWLAVFRAADGSLPWQCPSCASSPLRVVPDSLRDGETRASKAGHEHEGWDPDHIEGRFSCLADCGHCANVVGLTGVFRVQDDRFHDERFGDAGDYEKYYRPCFFTESPLLVDMPDATPDSAVAELVASFQLFWCDPLACTNRIRSAVEKLLTEQRVPQTTRTKGKRHFLTLHSRIDKYRAKRADIADALMAVKWIGNAGSHSSSVTTEDALDGYELMDRVLDSLYARRHRRAASLTKTINRRRAPRSPRRGSSR
jgi:hypothetical protein